MARLSTLSFLSEHWKKLPQPAKADLSGKTVVVVGANTGLGFEASKHFARMNPGRLILACRSAARGEAAIQKLEEETGYRSAEVWLIDLGEFSSVKAFADKFEQDGGRLDILVENAAIIDYKYEATTNGWESLLQVNYISLALLALLLLPRMIQTGKDHGTRPRLVAVSSFMHMSGKFEQKILTDKHILKTIGSKEYCTQKAMENRYSDTKLLNVLFIRALNDRIPASDHSVIVNSVNPGFCYSELRRDVGGLRAVVASIGEKLFARTTEEGSRTLVYAAVGQPDREDEMRGAYITCTHVAEEGDFVLSEEGRVAQNKIWDELVELLEAVDPRVRTTVATHLTEVKN